MQTTDRPRIHQNATTIQCYYSVYLPSLWSTSPSTYTSIRLLRSTPDAEGNHPYYSLSIKAAHASLLAQPYTPILQSLLGNGEALASTDARRDHAVLDFLVTFLSRKKWQTKIHCKQSNFKTLTNLKAHPKWFYSKAIHLTIYLLSNIKFHSFPFYLHGK